ncbi:MAG: hypothetical protein H7641_07670 [Candidatus Heimdallarchaeota archaeon]|nr:hypothetical protein [Candidatus Heimdallarchaeota archaeon]MCK4877442.1 hypothetical protein [Candidatus Heimdallarchaeota archaeon]
MLCPYCGYLKAKNTKENIRKFSCPRCDYQFEKSIGEVVLEKILSIPFSSVIYSPIILGLNFVIAKYTFPEESVVTLGIFYTFNILMSAFVVLSILYITRGRKASIMLFERKKKRSFFEALNDASPLVKITIILFLASIIMPFVVH